MGLYDTKEIARVFKVYEEDIKQCIEKGLLKKFKYTRETKVCTWELKRFIRMCIHSYLKQQNII